MRRSDRLLSVTHIFRSAGFNFKAATGPLEQALRIARELHGDEDRRTLDIRQALATAYVDGGRLSDAKEMLEDALTVRRSLLAPNDPELAKSITRLADVVAESGEYSDAIALSEESLGILLSQKKQDPASIGSGYLSLGIHQGEGGDARAALWSFRGCMMWWKRAYGAEDHWLGLCASHLATTCLLFGNRKESYEYCRQARAISEKNPDPDDPFDARVLAITLEESAALLDRLGRPVEAQEARDDAEALRKRHQPGS